MRALVLALLLTGCVVDRDLGAHAAPGDASPSIQTPPPPRGGPKIVFVTDGRYTGDLATEGGGASGLAGADAVCTREARNAGRTGTFKAWLSTATQNAKDRIAAVGPWRSVDGTVVFANAAADRPAAFLRFTAAGTDLLFSTSREVWTGTNALGLRTASGATCGDWTTAVQLGTYGELAWINPRWTDAQDVQGSSATKPCTEHLRLYCFEQ